MADEYDSDKENQNLKNVQMGRNINMNQIMKGPASIGA